MNRRNCVVAVVLFWSALPHAQVTAQEAPDLRAITNVNVVDVRTGTVLPGRTVVIAEGRIRSVERDGTGPTGAHVTDGTGKFLIPAYWDMHVHLRDEVAPRLLFPQFVANGVLGVREMASDCDDPESRGVCASTLRDWAAQIESEELLGPRIHALSSFPLNPPWDYDLGEEEARDVVRRLAERGVDLLKIYYRLSPEAFRWIMDEAGTRGLTASGHIPIRMTATEASDAGLRSIEHARDFLFDCFPGSAEFRSTTRSQNPPMDVMRSMVVDHDRAQCAEAFRTLVRNETWYVPTHVTRRMDAYADDTEFRDDPRQKYIPARAWEGWTADADRMVALDPSPEGRRTMRSFYEEGLAITGRAHAAGVKIVLGTDAGDTYVFPGSSVQDELGELVKAGLTPAEALASATFRAAEFLGLESEYGTVESGKRADLVLLGANPLEDIDNSRAIETVFYGTRTLTRADLDEMLTDVEALVLSAGS